MNQTFILHGRPSWDRLVAFVKANHGAKLLGITVFDADEKKRSAEANRFYWKARMEYLAENAWVNGERYSKEAWHEFYAEKYAPRIELRLPNGETKTVRTSTSDMKVGEFQTYIMQIEAHAATNLGIEFE